MWQWNAVTSTASVITMTYDNLLDGEYAIYIVAYNIDNNTKAQARQTYFTIQTKPVTYSVTLDADGGTINSGNVTSYTEGVGATLPTDVTRTATPSSAGLMEIQKSKSLAQMLPAISISRLIGKFLSPTPSRWIQTAARSTVGM